MKQLLIPTMVFPYAVCFGAASLFSEYMMYNFFGGSISNILIPLLVLWALAAICNIFYVLRVNSSKRRSRRVIKELLAVKLWHIPAFLGIAFFGFMMMPDAQLVAGITLIAVFALILIAFVSVFVIYRHYGHENITFMRCVLAIIFQFVPVLDILCLYSLYKNAKRKRRRKHALRCRVMKISGSFAYLYDGNGKETLVAVDLLPDGVEEGSELRCEGNEYSLAD